MDVSSDSAASTEGADASLPWWAAGTTQPVLPPRRMRTWIWRKALNTLAAGTLVTLGMGVVLVGLREPLHTEVPGGGVATRQSAQALIAGCGPTFDFGQVLQESGAVPAVTTSGSPNYVHYRTIVPMFGHFWDEPAPTDGSRFWSVSDQAVPGPENVLANQWRGWMVAYYTAAAPAKDVASLKTLASTRGDLRMLVLPWPSARRGLLPADRKIAYAAWGASQTCQRMSGPVLQAFRDAHPSADAPGATATRTATDVATRPDLP